MLINNLTRYLTILGGAYKTVANTPSATGLMSEMLMKELEKPEANLGFETKDLYTDFAKIVLKKTGEAYLGGLQVDSSVILKKLYGLSSIRVQARCTIPMDMPTPSIPLSASSWM